MKGKMPACQSPGASIAIAMLGAVFSVAVLVTPVSAKKPLAADEAAVRAMIERLYAPYLKPPPEMPEDGTYGPDNPPGSALDGSELPYTRSLAPLVARWGAAMQKSEEVYSLNDFDWYCQCQDNDPTTSKLVRQTYKLVGKDAIDADILFSPGSYKGKASGEPLLFRFRREDGAWKLDDLKFHKFTTLRKGLASDISDAEKDAKKAK